MTPKSFNSVSFSNFINDLHFPSGSVFLLDNVKFHHSKIVKDTFKNKDYETLYIPLIVQFLIQLKEFFL